jgi:hypothetical protein
MPAGLLALVALPFGFDGPLWRVMGAGVEWMDAIALWVASLPGAVGRIPAFNIAAVIVATAGLCVICLLHLGSKVVIVKKIMQIQCLVGEGVSRMGCRVTAGVTINDRSLENERLWIPS